MAAVIYSITGDACTADVGKNALLLHYEAIIAELKAMIAEAQRDVAEASRDMIESQKRLEAFEAEIAKRVAERDAIRAKNQYFACRALACDRSAGH